ncbi:MAG TPA: hypothetical protein VF720_07165 [Candidatus Eisenbacteria bacterium]
MHLRPVAIGLAVAAGLVFSGCSKKSDTAGGGAPRAKRAPGSPPPFALPPNNQPATYIGTFDDTPSWSERWTVWLRPDSTYFLREEHVGHGDVASDHSEDDIGRWERATDGGPIRLQGGRNQPFELDVPHPDTLRFRIVDQALGVEPHFLVRTDSIAYFEPRVSLTGTLRLTADAALFDDCASSLRWPVLKEEGFSAAEVAYRQSAVNPGDALLVSIEGRVVRRPRMNDGPARDYLVIERFGQWTPGGRCGEPSPAEGLPYGAGK